MRFDVPRAEFAFEARVRCAPPQLMGRTPDGVSQMIPILGGTITGPKLSGEVLAGGADWPVTREDGVTIVEAHYGIRAEDGTIIQVFNRGLAIIERGAAQPVPHIRTVPRFVAPDGPHSWLNRRVFVGTVEADPNDLSNVAVRIFELL